MSDVTAPSSEAASTVSDPAKGSRRAERIAQWFRSMTRPGDGNGRAVMARLRRCPTPESAACSGEVFQLARSIRNGNGPVTEHDLVRAGFIAGILSHVREDLQGRSFGATLATSRKAAEEGGGASSAKASKGKPRFSEQRFAKLCDARGPQESFLGFRRAVSIVDDKASVQSLAGILVDWLDDRPDDRDVTRRRTRADSARIGFARDYYEAL